MPKPGINGIGSVQFLHPTNLILQQLVESLLLYTNLIIALGEHKTNPSNYALNSHHIIGSTMANSER